MFLFIFIFLFNFVYGSQQKENVKLQRINLCDLKNKNLIAYNNLMQTLIHEVMGHLFSSYWLDSNDKECPFALILKNRTECEKTEMLGALGFTCSFRSSFYREKKSLPVFFYLCSGFAAQIALEYKNFCKNKKELNLNEDYFCLKMKEKISGSFGNEQCDIDKAIVYALYSLKEADLRKLENFIFSDYLNINSKFLIFKKELEAILLLKNENKEDKVLIEKKIISYEEKQKEPYNSLFLKEQLQNFFFENNIIQTAFNQKFSYFGPFDENCITPYLSENKINSIVNLLYASSYIYSSFIYRNISRIEEFLNEQINKKDFSICLYSIKKNKIVDDLFQQYNEIMDFFGCKKEEKNISSDSVLLTNYVEKLKKNSNYKKNKDISEKDISQTGLSLSMYEQNEENFNKYIAPKFDKLKKIENKNQKIKYIVPEIISQNSFLQKFIEIYRNEEVQYEFLNFGKDKENLYNEYLEIKFGCYKILDECLFDDTRTKKYIGDLNSELAFLFVFSDMNVTIINDHIDKIIGFCPENFNQARDYYLKKNIGDYRKILKKELGKLYFSKDKIQDGGKKCFFFGDICDDRIEEFLGENADEQYLKIVQDEYKKIIDSEKEIMSIFDYYNYYYNNYYFWFIGNYNEVNINYFVRYNLLLKLLCPNEQIHGIAKKRYCTKKMEEQVNIFYDKNKDQFKQEIIRVISKKYFSKYKIQVGEKKCFFLGDICDDQIEEFLGENADEQYLKIVKDEYKKIIDSEEEIMSIFDYYDNYYNNYYFWFIGNYNEVNINYFVRYNLLLKLLCPNEQIHGIAKKRYCTKKMEEQVNIFYDKNKDQFKKKIISVIPKEFFSKYKIQGWQE